MQVASSSPYTVHEWSRCPELQTLHVHDYESLLREENLSNRKMQMQHTFSSLICWLMAAGSDLTGCVMDCASLFSATLSQGNTWDAWLSYSRNWRQERSKMVPCSLSSNRSLKKKPTTIEGFAKRCIWFQDSFLIFYSFNLTVTGSCINRTNFCFPTSHVPLPACLSLVWTPFSSSNLNIFIFGNVVTK